MLELAILGMLEEQDLHGYQIRKQLREHVGLLTNVSFGSLYPALARLEAGGAVVATEGGSRREPSQPSPPPPTGSLSGEWAVLRSHRARRSGRSTRSTRSTRSRKVYRITDQGRRRFTELLAEAPGPDDGRSFALRLAFARHLPAPARLSLLERRRTQLVERLAAAEAISQDPQHDVYARSVVEHSAHGLADDIQWLDQLIAAERGTRKPAATPSTPPAPKEAHL